MQEMVHIIVHAIVDRRCDWSGTAMDPGFPRGEKGVVPTICSVEKSQNPQENKEKRTKGVGEGGASTIPPPRSATA